MCREKFTSITLIFSLLVAVMMAHAPTATATVTWNFFQTSLVYAINGQPVPGFVPHVAGFLTISDADFSTGGVSYSAINHNFPDIPPNYTITGPTDFSFSVESSGFDNVFLPVSSSNPLVGDAIINIGTTAAGIISGSVKWDGRNIIWR